MFKVGEMVLLYRRLSKLEEMDWNDSWVRSMDSHVGSIGEVVECLNEKYKVYFGQPLSYWYPQSCLLEIKRR